MEFKRELRVGDWVRPMRYYDKIGKIFVLNLKTADMIVFPSEYINRSCTFNRISKLEPVFDFDYFKGQRLIIHCESEEEFDIFVSLLKQEESSEVWMIKRISGHYICDNFNRTLSSNFNTNTIKSIDFKNIINNTYKNVYREYNIDKENTDMFDKKETKKPFTKSDLRNGDVVKRRNGSVEIVVKEAQWVEDGFIRKDGYTSLCFINNDLRHKEFKEFDIMQVRRPSYISECHFGAFEYNHGTLVYNREEEPLWNGRTYEENHRILWNMLADNPNMSKEEVFDKTNINREKHPLDNCFACEYAKFKGDSRCDKCPICYREADKNCLNGLFDKWNKATGFERACIAHEIANLEWIDK